MVQLRIRVAAGMSVGKVIHKVIRRDAR
jgi:hypothetical protein